MTGFRRWLWYGPAAVWAAFLLYLGSRSFDVPVAPYAFPLDKVAHIVLYGVLGLLAAFGWRRAGRWPHFLVPLVLALAVGVLDELNQRSVAARTADPFDFLADLIAIVIVFAILIRRDTRTEAE